MLKQLLSTLKVVTLALVLFFGLSYALAWTTPTATPPGDNVAAPLNASATDQIKAGGITAGSLTTTGLTNTGTLRVTTGAGVTKVLTSDASGNATWQTPSTGADNLGNHTATQNLSLGANNIVATGADVAHGTMTVQGEKAGWAGINFRDAAGTVNYGTLMMNTITSGFYNNAHTAWRWYVSDTGSSVQAGSVTAGSVSVSGNVSATGDVYGGGKWLSTTQNRVTGTCAVGSAVTAIAANGTVTCGTAVGLVKYGGGYQTSSDGWCTRANLATGACSCPSGYTTLPVVGGGSGYNNVFCEKL